MSVPPQSPRPQFCPSRLAHPSLSLRTLVFTTPARSSCTWPRFLLERQLLRGTAVVRSGSRSSRRKLPSLAQAFRGPLAVSVISSSFDAFTDPDNITTGESLATIPFTIPAATPSGDYLIRMEQIALHVASSVGGAQFYLSCGQVTVTGGGSGTPGPLVAFPGAYSATDPGILIDVYYPIVSC